MVIKNKKYFGKTIAVSGGFDPIHVGHLAMFEDAKKIVGDSGKLLVFVNSDDFLERKKGKAFMKISDRLRIIRAFSVVDKAFKVVDKDMTVCKTLLKYRPNIFANGGDRTKNNIPEFEICKKNGIGMLFGVGGKKIRSSSFFLKKYSESKSF